MIRLFGILTGSALAVSLLIIALGIPEFAPAGDPETSASPIAETLESTAPEPVTVQDVEIATAPVPVTASETERAPESLTPTEPTPTLPQPGAQTEPALTPPQPEPGWYSFWSPFRSRIAADGFVSELQRTTGIDYRVVKIKPGIYEVAFAYADDADIQDKLTQISAATGLDMSGG